MQKQQTTAVLNKLARIENLLEEQKRKPLTLVEAAQYLSISQSHLYRLTSQRKIPSHKPNGKYLYFFTDELNEWIQNKEKAESRSEGLVSSKEKCGKDEGKGRIGERENKETNLKDGGQEGEIKKDSDSASEDEATSDREPP